MNSYKKIYLIVESLQDEKTFANVILHLKTQYNLEPIIQSHTQSIEEELNALYLLYLSDNEIKIFFKSCVESNIAIAIIPNNFCPFSMKNYGISKDIFEAIDDGFNQELLSKIDLLQCNELIVLNRIIIGDMHGMGRFNFNEKNYFEKLKIFIDNLKNITFKSYTITTSKDQKIQTAASGITIIDHFIANEKSTFSETLSNHDGKLNAFVLAPSSLISYLWYLISIFFYQRISTVELPKSLGFIKSSKLIISSNKSIDFTVDNNLLSTQEVVVEVLQDSINLHLGRSLKDFIKSDTNKIEEKDSIRLNSLPQGEINNILIGGDLPFFPRASDDDFKELFISLRNSSKFSYVFLILMILSTLLATTGLFANSAPVIIGAMILAPLMSPIVSLSMGVIRADKFLLEQSVRTLILGIVMALFCSSLFTLFIPLEQITPEMQGRLNPNLLDLMVAIFSGIAGAYANAKEEVTKSLAGVAIAVALVPPLSVTGIGLGLGNFEVIYGSFLLFITNLVGITLSAALTFIILGYSPVRRAKKGILYTTIMMIVITIPLILSFLKMVEQNDYMNKLKPLKYITLEKSNIELNVKNIKINEGDIVISLEVLTNHSLEQSDLIYIKNEIQTYIHEKVTLNITTKIIVK
ncbi:MAG: TIGR00341 family protein [Arcobacteraceae bacterium]|jgi:uncharacterized hydrophobic protein (TIGR00271 family)|nr:TIGR00341 family protein [Arcobacteraceae bacterium]